MQFIKADKYYIRNVYLNHTPLYYNMTAIKKIVSLLTEDNEASLAIKSGLKSRITLDDGQVIYSTLNPEDLIEILNRPISSYYTYIP